MALKYGDRLIVSYNLSVYLILIYYSLKIIRNFVCRIHLRRYLTDCGRILYEV